MCTFRKLQSVREKIGRSSASAEIYPPSRAFEFYGMPSVELVLEAQNPFQVLQVPLAASVDEIKKSYKRLALLFHPDKNTAPLAAEAFIRISEAYQALSVDLPAQRLAALRSGVPAMGTPPSHTPGATHTSPTGSTASDLYGDVCGASGDMHGAGVNVDRSRTHRHKYTYYADAESAAGLSGAAGVGAYTQYYAQYARTQHCRPPRAPERGPAEKTSTNTYAGDLYRSAAAVAARLAPCLSLFARVFAADREELARERESVRGYVADTSARAVREAEERLGISALGVEKGLLAAATGARFGRRASGAGGLGSINCEGDMVRRGATTRSRNGTKRDSGDVRELNAVLLRVQLRPPEHAGTDAGAEALGTFKDPYAGKTPSRSMNGGNVDDLLQQLRREPGDGAVGGSAEPCGPAHHQPVEKTAGTWMFPRTMSQLTPGKQDALSRARARMHQLAKTTVEEGIVRAHSLDTDEQARPEQGLAHAYARNSLPSATVNAPSAHVACDERALTLFTPMPLPLTAPAAASATSSTRSTRAPEVVDTQVLQLSAEDRLLLVSGDLFMSSGRAVSVWVDSLCRFLQWRHEGDAGGKGGVKAVKGRDGGSSSTPDGRLPLDMVTDVSVRTLPSKFTAMHSNKPTISGSAGAVLRVSGGGVTLSLRPAAGSEQLLGRWRHALVRAAAWARCVYGEPEDEEERCM